MGDYKCVRCGKAVTRNVYYCSHHGWYLCWNCVQKAALTNELTCYKCGKEVSRVDG